MGLLRSLDVVSKAALKRFKRGLGTIIVAGLVLTFTGTAELIPDIQSVAPAGMFPSNPTAQLLIAGFSLFVV